MGRGVEKTPALTLPPQIANPQKQIRDREDP
jgi:hypothetical protein